MNKMKKIIVLLFVINVFKTYSQKTNDCLIPPQTHWKSFGFKKQVKQVNIAYYKVDSISYKPTMIEVYSFNKEGFIIQKYFKIFGKYASETATNYEYNNGLLDSINTYASSVNFNNKQKLHYNTNQKLTKIVANGKFSNFTDTYTYKNGLVNSIERSYSNGGRMTTYFNHNKNYSRIKETSVNGKITESYTVYDGTEKFASFYLGREPIVTFYKAYHHNDLDIEVNENALNYALKMRKLKEQEPNSFVKLMGELQGKPTTRTIFTIPAESRNETGDWIKRLQIDKQYNMHIRRLVFKKLIYADGSESGSTNFDVFFEKKVARLK